MKQKHKTNQTTKQVTKIIKNLKVSCIKQMYSPISFTIR